MKSPTTSSRLPASFRTGTTTTASLALGLSTAMLLPLTARAAEPQVEMGVMKVEDSAIDPNPNAEPGVPYKAKYSGDERHTRPIAELPQNITVLTKAMLDESGLTDLRDVLDAQPGITLGTGEGGNAFGDRYIIRGQEARSDVFVDGLRDPGLTIRESFAVEQVEISKGPNSSFAGRGTAGGAVNAITKAATRDYDFSKVSTAFGSDDHMRLTVDSNQVFGEHLAVRANALYGDENVPDREPAERERKGLAASALITPTENLEVILDYYGVRADDKPDLGHFLKGTVPDRKPAKDVPVYLQNQDFFESDVDTGTLRVRYLFSPNTRVTNTTRYGTTDNAYVVTGARASTTHATNPGGVYDTISLSTHQRWQDIEYFVNQTNLYLDRSLGGLDHQFIVGAEYADHSVRNGIFSVVNSNSNCIVANNSGAAANGWCATDANGNTVNGLRTLMDRQVARGPWSIDWNVDTISAYVMDTVDLTDRWTVFGGIRWDRFDFDTVTRNTTTLVETPYDYSDDLLNGHLGVSYEVTSNGRIYLSFATASDINGGESDVGSSCGYGGVCVDVTNGVDIADSKPEKSQLFELGTKWNLFEEKLLVTAALFQIDKRDVMEASPNSTGYVSDGSQNTGKNRVRGVEFGIVGAVTEQLTVQAGATFMDAKVRGSNLPESLGKTVSNFADETAFAQIKYEPFEPFAIGMGVRYEGKRYGGQPDSAPALTPTGDYAQPVPSYVVYNAFASYRFNKSLDMRVNVDNLTDKDYFLATYRSGSFLYKGDARNFRVTLNYDF